MAPTREESRRASLRLQHKSPLGKGVQGNEASTTRTTSRLVPPVAKKAKTAPTPPTPDPSRKRSRESSVSVQRGVVGKGGQAGNRGQAKENVKKVVRQDSGIEFTSAVVKHGQSPLRRTKVHGSDERMEGDDASSNPSGLPLSHDNHQGIATSDPSQEQPLSGLTTSLPTASTNVPPPCTPSRPSSRRGGPIRTASPTSMDIGLPSTPQSEWTAPSTLDDEDALCAVLTQTPRSRRSKVSLRRESLPINWSEKEKEIEMILREDGVPKSQGGGGVPMGGGDQASVLPTA